MSAAVSTTADTLPAPPPVKTCKCGRAYDADEWRRLAYVGPQDDGAGGVLELRNCACRSTLGIEVAA